MHLFYTWIYKIIYQIPMIYMYVCMTSLYLCVRNVKMINKFRGFSKMKTGRGFSKIFWNFVIEMNLVYFVSFIHSLFLFHNNKSLNRSKKQNYRWLEFKSILMKLYTQNMNIFSIQIYLKEIFPKRRRQNSKVISSYK